MQCWHKVSFSIIQYSNSGVVRNPFPSSSLPCSPEKEGNQPTAPTGTLRFLAFLYSANPKTPYPAIILYWQDASPAMKIAGGEPCVACFVWLLRRKKRAQLGPTVARARFVVNWKVDAAPTAGAGRRPAGRSSGCRWDGDCSSKDGVAICNDREPGRALQSRRSGVSIPAGPSRPSPSVGRR